MENAFQRTASLFGEDAMRRFFAAHVAVFGVGGVGGYVCEALARSGIGALDLIDNDKVHESNLNRQIVALHSTLGQDKVDVMRARILDINPQAQVTVHKTFFLPENADDFDFSAYDYVVDCVDTVAAKVELAVRCSKVGTPLISAMGAGNKLYPERFEVADIFDTSVCPLARAMRAQLRRRGVKKLKVVYSKEEPITPQGVEGRTPGSTAFTPSTAGLILAGAVLRDLAGKTDKTTKKRDSYAIS